MTHLEELTIKVDRLHKILHDPHPGLHVWRTFYRFAVDDMLAFFDAAPAQPNPAFFAGKSILAETKPSCCPTCGSPEPTVLFSPIGVDLMCDNSWHQIGTK